MPEPKFPSTDIVFPGLSGAFVGILACALLLLTAGSVQAADLDSPAAGRDAGPTVLLSYSKEAVKDNPLSSFLYFLPLISKTPVDSEASADNDQRVGFVSHERKVTRQSFQTVCDFDIHGKGFHRYKFDAAAMIAARARDKKDAKPMLNLLDYVQFEGECHGRIVIKGRLTGATDTVDQVELHFQARGKSSPVTIGLYDVKSRDGHYTYDNRSNESIARVNTLTFKRSKTAPTMGVTVDSITRAGAPEGVLAGLRGAVANLFLIKPPRVDPAGNAAVLELGSAMSAREPAFTFPKAKNFRETKEVAHGVAVPAGAQSGQPEYLAFLPDAQLPLVKCFQEGVNASAGRADTLRRRLRPQGGTAGPKSPYLNLDTQFTQSPHSLA